MGRGAAAGVAVGLRSRTAASAVAPAEGIARGILLRWHSGTIDASRRQSIMEKAFGIWLYRKISKYMAKLISRKLRANDV